MIIRYYEREPHMVKYDSAKFGGYKLCGSGDFFNLPPDLIIPRDSRTM